MPETLLKPGQTFAGYHLVDRISRGGMGEVWRATKAGPEGWSKTVALKVILPTMADQERFAHMFLREARIAAQLDHPNIVPVFAFGKDGERLWFEQEFVEGRDLAAWIRQGKRFPIPLALFVVGELLKALDYAHSRADDEGKSLHIVHRDIKPHNVLVADQGHVKLVDFGIAKIAADATASHSMIKGTAGYLAPEVLEGRKATPASDLFGVGVVLWELLTLRRLFPGDEDAARIKATLQDPIPRLAHADIDAPEVLEEFMRRLLARNPFDRPQTADAAHNTLLQLPGARAAGSRELRAFLAGGGGNADANETAPQTPRARAAKSDGVPIAVNGDAATPGSVPVAHTVTEPVDTSCADDSINAAMHAETRTAVPAIGSAPTSPTGALAGEMSATEKERVRPLGVYVAAGVAALVVAVVAGAWWLTRTAPRSGVENRVLAAAVTHDASPTTTISVVEPSRSSPDAASVATVRVVIEVDPVDARVSVDGEPIPGTSPFTWTAGADANVTIVARRRGYRTIRRSVTTADVDLRVSIEMDRVKDRARPQAQPPATEAKPKRDKDAIFLPD